MVLAHHGHSCTARDLLLVGALGFDVKLPQEEKGRKGRSSFSEC
jgi:hypothetical protein